MRIFALIIWLGIAAAHGAAAQPGIALPGECLAAPYTGTDTAPRARLAALVARLRPALARFHSLRDTLTAGPVICLSTALRAEHGYMSVDERRIVLDARLGRDRLLLTLIHELRHVEQLRQGTCPPPGLSMRENARATFAIEADANVVVALVAWVARHEGDPAPWQAFAAWQSTADIAAAFERAMTETGDPAQAASAAFDAWYARPERRETYYIQSCSDYLDRQDERHALPAYGHVAGDFLERLCRLPDGTAYACTEPPGALDR